MSGTLSAENADAAISLRRKTHLSREWTISILGATLFHVAALFAYQAMFDRPPRPLPLGTVQLTVVSVTPESASDETSSSVSEGKSAQSENSVTKTEPVSAEKSAEPIRPEPVVPEVTLAVQQSENESSKVAALQPESAPARPVGGDSESVHPQQEIPSAPPQAGQRAEPVYRRNPKPVYPTLSRRRGEEGLVVLRAQVSSRGQVSSVEVKRSSGFSLLDDAALKAVRKWEFEPRLVNWVAVQSEVEVPVQFKLRN